MTSTMKEQFAIYSRKSKFTGKGESIENQIELCRQYIRVNFGDAAAASALVYEDEGFSGGNLKRPQFKKMMEDAGKGKFTSIVVYRLDRISRNIGDFAGLIEELNDRKISFVSIKEQFDTQSPMGRAMMYIASVFSQLERETIAERIRDNMHELSKTGRWLGGTTPTGYASEQVKRITVDGKVRKACKLRLVPAEAEMVKTIFMKFMETNSLTQTDAFLLQNGYVTKNGKHFTRFTIKGILTNPVYMKADEAAWEYLKRQQVDLFSARDAFDGEHGVIAYNRTIQKPGKANKIRPMEEWIVSVGAHPGLIGGADWVKVQSLLEQNRSKGYRKPRSNVALLSGLLYCGNCGGYMRPKLSQRENTCGEPLYSYVCTMKERSHGQCCNMCNVSGNLMDQAVVEEVKKLSEDSGEFLRQLEQGKKMIAGDQEGYNAQMEGLQRALAENEQKIQGLVSAVGKAAGTSAEAYILRQIDALHETGERLRGRRKELGQYTAGPVFADAEFDLLRQMLASFGVTIDAMSVEEKRAAIRTCIQKIVWDGENVHLYLFGSEKEAEIIDRNGIGEPLGEDSK